MERARLRRTAGALLAAAVLAGCAGSSYEEEVAGEQARYDADAEAADLEVEAPEPVAAEPAAISADGVRGAFEYGWEMSCNDVFAYTPDGNRYYDDVAYDYDDCVGLLEVDMPQLIDALADSRDVSGDAEKVGRVVALDAVFEEFASVLCYGEDCVTRGDFGPY